MVAAAERALGERNLVLVGFMGTGKSSLGRAAARALGRRFDDTDAAVRRRAGRSIPEIFATEGEAVFRAWEAEAAADLGRAHRGVVATGGGTLGWPENVAALRSGGVLVALTAAPSVLLARVGGLQAARRRPLLAGPDPLARIEELLRQRSGLYAQADLTLDTGGLRRDAAVRALLRLCAERAGAVRRSAGGGDVAGPG